MFVILTTTRDGNLEFNAANDPKTYFLRRTSCTKSNKKIYLIKYSENIERVHHTFLYVC